MLNLTVIPPCTSLKDLVYRYIVFEGNFPNGAYFNQDVIPALTEFITFNLNGNPQLFIVNQQKLVCKDCFVTGLHVRPYQAILTGDIKLVAFQFRPPDLSQVFDLPMHYLSNTSVNLSDLVGNEAHDWWERICEKKTIAASIEVIEEFVLSRLAVRSLKTEHDFFSHSLRLIRQTSGKIAVKELAESMNNSERTLQRLFLNHSGLSPKLYTRFYRFNEVIRHFNATHKIRPDFIHQLGYFDQAHFIREFKSFAGESPQSYFKLHPGVNEFFSKY